MGLLAPGGAAAGARAGAGPDGAGADPRAAGAPLAEAPDEHGIINGEGAVEADHPNAGGLLIDTVLDVPDYGTFPLRTFICSSTLIAPDVVLTAAHCVDPEAITYGYGTLSDTQYFWSRQADLSAYDGRGREEFPEDSVEALDWVMHPGFDLYRMQLGLAENDDIALIFLSEAVLDVAPALLPTPEEAAALSVGTPVVVVGWGQQTHVPYGSQPPRGSYMIKQQGVSSIAEIDAPELKVGELEGGVRKCHGDSGGPSFAEIGVGTVHLTRLVGVTSHAYDRSDCAETGGVDTRVDFHLEWIDAELRARCADGTRVWCEVEGILPPDHNDPPAAEDDGDGEVAELDGRDGGGQKQGCQSAPGLGFGAPAALLALGGALRRRRRA
jgi:uncharacterized protein (TIGR03382 family)